MSGRWRVLEGGCEWNGSTLSTALWRAQRFGGHSFRRPHVLVTDVSFDEAKSIDRLRQAVHRCGPVTYDEFIKIWESALLESDLPIMGAAANMTLDLRTLDRSYEVRVEPVGRQDAEPFFVAAKLGWRWSALSTARSAWREEEVLTEFHGRESAHTLETKPPWLRVDIELSASLPWGQPRPVPPKDTLARWVHELHERLERIEPLLPEETSRLNDEGSLEVLGWQGLPELDVALTADGEPQLCCVHLSAWQAIDLPRHFDDPDREDEGPEEALKALFVRVRKALMTWMESLDLLPLPDGKPRDRRGR